VEGDKICREVIKNRPELIDKLFATQNWLDSNDLNSSFPFNHTIVTEKELSIVSNMVTNTQALLILHQKPLLHEYTKHSENHELILDNIQDPGNMGTILRIADWFGIKKVICTKGCVDVFNPKVIQSTMGAFLRVETIQNHDVINLLNSQNKPVFAGLLDGKPLEEVKEKEKGYIIVGNESKGISSEIQKHISHPVRISGNGNAESLNVGVATGIICHHLLINN